MKQLSIHFINLVLALFLGHQALAQASFGTGPNSVFSFTIGNASVFGQNTLDVPNSGSSFGFSIYVFKPTSDAQTQGTVSIYAGDNNGNLASSAINGTQQTVAWLSGQLNNQTYALAQGNCNLSGAIIGNNTKLYAVFTPATGSLNTVPVISLGIPINFTSPNNGSPSASSNPCGSLYDVGICGNQCVPYGSLPQRLNGTNYPYTSPNGYTRTMAWEYSYSSNSADWHTLTNETQASYVPQACFRTTYYRRKDFSERTNIWGQTYHDEYGVSNVVTITPQTVPTTPVQSVVTACTQATMVAVALNPVAPAVSYNWWVPYAGWGVSTDGLSPFSTYNQNTSFVSPSPNVVITLPAGGVTPGTYPIAFNTSGACGPKSTDGIINIVVSSAGAAPTPTSAQYVKASSQACNPTYNLRTSVVAGATSYSASDTNGNSAVGTIAQGSTGGPYVLFSFNESGPVYGVVATVSASGPCGTGFYTTQPTNLNGPAPKCGSLRSASIDLYPNPASDKVTVITSGQAGTVVLYDALGVVRKSVKLQAGTSELEISTQDLLAGVYYVRVLIPGLAPFNKQLIIQP